MMARHFPMPAIIRTATFIVALGMAACATPPVVKPVTGPTPEEVARQAKIERAKAMLGEGVKSYESGAYDDALKNLLLALDSGSLNLAEQLRRRGLIEPGLECELPDGIQNPQRPQTGHFGGVFRAFKAHMDMRLSCQVVDLIGTRLVQCVIDRRRVCQVSLAKMQPGSVFRPQQVSDP